MNKVFNSDKPIEILIIKHSVEGVNLWKWSLYQPWTFGLHSLESWYNNKSESEARDAWKEWANDNGITNWKFQEDNVKVDVRTGSGSYI